MSRSAVDSDADPGQRPTRSLFRDGASVLTVRMIGLPVAFLTGLVTARYLGTDGKGLFAALTAVPYLVVSLAEAGVRQSATQTLGSHSQDSRKVLGTVLWLLAGSSVLGLALTAIGFLASGGVTALGGTLPTAMAVGAALLVPARLGVSYMRGVLLGVYRITQMNRTEWALPVLTLLLTVLFVAVLRLDVAGAVAAVVLATVLTAALALVLVHRHVGLNVRFDRTLARQLIGRGAVYALALFAIELNYRADVVVLSRYAADAQLGLYSVGVNIVEVILQLPGALGTIIFARSAEAADARRFSLETARISRLTFLVLLGCALPAAVVAEPVIRLLYGAEFGPSAEAFRILLPGVVMLGVFKVLNMDIAGRGRPGLTLAVMLPSAMVNIALNLLWVPQYGYVGAAWSSTVSYAAATLVFVVVFARVTGVPVREVVRLRAADVRSLWSAATRLLSRGGR